MKNQNKSSKGFSLVELIVVIAIMAILVGVMAPSLMKQIEKSKESKDTTAIDSIRSSVEAAITDPEYEFDLGAYNLTEPADGAAVSITLETLLDTTTPAGTFSTDCAGIAEEIRENLKGNEETNFSSKAYNGQKLEDAYLWFDSQGNVKVVVYHDSYSATETKYASAGQLSKSAEAALKTALKAGSGKVASIAASK